jgi:Ca2+-binding EF-hand superfamily protein
VLAADHDGQIAADDLRKTMKKMGFDQVDEQTVQNVLREVDADNDGQVSVRSANCPRS